MHHKKLVLLTIPLLLIVLTSTIIGVAETLFPSIILPEPQLYSMISKDRILIPYKPLCKAIVDGENYIVDNETGNIAIGMGGYIRIEHPQPRPMVIINIPKGILYNYSAIESLVVTVNFTREPSNWNLHINFTGENKALVYVTGYDYSQNKEYLTETVIVDGVIERIEVGYIPGTLYMYVKFSQGNMMFYYPLPDKSLVESIELKGSGVFYGEVYSVQLLSTGPEIVIPAEEQTIVGGVTYYITRSATAYLALTPFNVEIRLLRMPIATEVTYKKQLTTVIDLPYATGILEAYLQPTLNGMIIDVNATFYHLLDIDKLIDQYYYYVKYFMVEYEVHGIIVANNTVQDYLLGTYTVIVNDTINNLFIPLPQTFDKYMVIVRLKVPGVLYGGGLFGVEYIDLGKVVLKEGLIQVVNLTINNPFIEGRVDLVLLRKVELCTECFGLNTTVYVIHMVDVNKFIDRYFPYLRHYYLVTTVTVGDEQYSMEKPIEGNNVSYELQVPLNDTYTIDFTIKAPGIVYGIQDPTKVSRDAIASYTIKLIVPEPEVVIDLPLILNVVAEKIPGEVTINIPVKVQWTPSEKVLLMTPTVYKVYLVNPFTGTQELLYSVWSRWLSDADIVVDVPVIMNVHDIVVEVSYFLGNRWVTTSKRITLNITLPPPPPNVTATNITNITITVPVNITNITVTITNCTFTETLTLTSTVYIANTTITETVANTTIYSTITETYNITTTTTETLTETTTTTTTVVEVATATFTVTTTTTPELPVLLVSPPYSYGIGAVVAVIVAAISLRYIRGLVGRVARRAR